jgi:predicted transcriptional regulator
LGKNRDSLIIIANILESAERGAIKTRIMFQANLSFKLLEKYLSSAVTSGLVRVEGCKYALTDRGREFLTQYKLFHERKVQAEKLLEDLSDERDRLSRLCKTS